MSHPLDNIPLLPHVFRMDFDVIIVGGGLTGITLALALDQSGVRTAIIDQNTPLVKPNHSFNGRSYAIAAASQKMLNVLGLWDNLTKNAQPMLEIKVSDGYAGEVPSPFVMQFNQQDFPEGPMGYMVEDRHLRQILQDALKYSKVTYLSNTQVLNQTVEATQVAAKLNSGASMTAKVLVGADGRTSSTAQAAGLTRSGWDYGQSSLVCAIKHEKPHNSIAHQYFMPPGPLAILPLKGNRSGIVWTEKAETARQIHALDNADYLDILRPRFGMFLGDISLEGERYIYPLSLSTTHRMISQRVALVGDAAHAVHPIAGQGLNSGFKDIAALAQVLCDTKRRGQDLGLHNTLKEYQQWRGFDNAMLCTATNGFNRLFSNGSSVIRSLRGLGMGLVGSTPMFRQAFVANAAGTTGDVPKLLLGKPI